MRWVTLLVMMLASPLLAGCGDLASLVLQDLDGRWVSRVDGEKILLRVNDDRGYLSGTGEWGADNVYVSGDREESRVLLTIEFGRFNPIEFEGQLEGWDLKGRLYGSGYDGTWVVFRRE
ncbi:MAG: hypothetical protein LBG44_02645 [Gemmatimonadota bacterium]|jgi:hypothetical protein|nr:hypothetical protein [Gemmatimonadota bacterium]